MSNQHQHDWFSYSGNILRRSSLEVFLEDFQEIWSIGKEWGISVKLFKESSKYDQWVMC